MADVKISALTELAEAPADADEFVVVDKSDTTMAASGTDKRVKHQNVGVRTLYDAKGDVLVASADNTPAKLSVGSDYQVLQAKASASTGTQWASPILSITAATFVSTYQSNASTYSGLYVFLNDGGALYYSDGSTWKSLLGLNVLTTKGDIAVYNGTLSAPVRIGVGLDGTTPMADSSLAGGLIWGTPGGGQYPAQNGPFASAVATTATGGTNTWYASAVALYCRTTVTGVRYRVGTTQNGNQRCALYDATGTKVADRTTDQTGGTASAFRNLAFDSTVTIVPGIYFALTWFASATATFFGGRTLAASASGTNATTSPTTITPITTSTAINVDVPAIQLY